MANLIKVTKEVTFECAHMLSGYNGACANLHGHSYKVHVIITAEQIDNPSASNNAMVIDFSDMKKLIEQQIVDHFDHAVIFSGPKERGEAENELLSWARKHRKKFYVMPGRTTCEEMALLFKRLLIQVISGAGEINVKVWETATSSAEV